MGCAQPSCGGRPPLNSRRPARRAGRRAGHDPDRDDDVVIRPGRVPGRGSPRLRPGTLLTGRARTATTGCVRVGGHGSGSRSDVGDVTGMTAQGGRGASGRSRRERAIERATGPARHVDVRQHPARSAGAHHPRAAQEVREGPSAPLPAGPEPTDDGQQVGDVRDLARSARPTPIGKPPARAPAAHREGAARDRSSCASRRRRQASMAACSRFVRSWPCEPPRRWDRRRAPHTPGG